MEEGIDRGMTYHEASMTRVSKQFDNLLNYSNVEDTGFYNPFKGLQGESEKVVEIQKEAKRVIGTQVMPAFQKLRGIVIKVTFQLILVHIKTYSPKRIVTTVYTIYCSYYPFK